MLARKLISRNACREPVSKTFNILKCWSTENGVFVWKRFYRPRNDGILANFSRRQLL